MTKLQTSVSNFPAVGRVGAIANNNPKFATSNVAEEVMKAGIFVKLGTDNAIQIKKLAESIDIELGKLWGVSLHDTSRETPVLNIDDSGGEGVRDFAINEEVAVMKQGSVYMKPETAMTPASPIFIRHAGRKQVQTLTLDGDLITDNVVNGSIGGIAIAPVTFAVDHETTMGVLAQAILTANSNIESAVVSLTPFRVITITTLQDADDQDLGGDWVVTLGAGQAGITEAETITSVHTDNIGRIRNDSDSSTATVAPTGTVRVLDKISADGIGAVSINLN